MLNRKVFAYLWLFMFVALGSMVLSKAFVLSTMSSGTVIRVDNNQVWIRIDGVDDPHLWKVVGPLSPRFKIPTENTHLFRFRWLPADNILLDFWYDNFWYDNDESFYEMVT